MKSALRRLPIAIYALLSRVLPKRQRRLCFVGTPGADNAYAFFQYLLQSRGEEYRYVWLVPDAESAGLLQERHAQELREQRLRVLQKRSLHAIGEMLTCRYVFFTHATYWFARCGHGQRIVNLWHGMPLKRIGNLNPNRFDPTPFCHHTIASSPFFRSIMAQCFGLSPDDVLLTGQPRNDWLSRRGAMRACPLFAARSYSSTVAWMPTYRTYRHPKGGMWVDSTDDFLRRMLRPESLSAWNARLAARDVLCLIKLHPLDELNAQDYPAMSHVVVVREVEVRRHRLNIYELLADCDRLVTDFSSVFIDFALTGRPMAFFAPDLDEYTTERGLIEDVWNAVGLPGVRLTDEDELYAFLAGDVPGVDVPAEAAAAMHDGYAPPSCPLLARQLCL